MFSEFGIVSVVAPHWRVVVERDGTRTVEAAGRRPV
jgi:hypothetical protein